MKLTNFTKSLAGLALVGAFTLGGAAQADRGYGKLEGWSSAAGEAVDEVMVYPKSRVRGSGNGTAIFLVTIDDDGKVIESEQTQSTPSRALDIAARKVVKTADFPALPESLDAESLTFELRLNYGTSLRHADPDALRKGRVTSRQIAKTGSPVMASLKVVSLGE